MTIQSSPREAVWPLTSATARRWKGREANARSRSSRLLRKLPTAILLAVGLSACSPYVYGPEIAKFADGVTAIAAADKGAKLQRDSDRANVDRITWAQRLDNNLRPKSCTQSAKGCAISDPDPLPIEAGWNAARAKIDKARNASNASLKVLQIYAKALQAITNAEDTAALNGAQMEFTAALGALGKRVNNESASAKLGATASLFAAVSEAGLNYSRHQALKKATAAGHESIVKLAEVLGKELNTLRDSRITELARQLDLELAELSQAKSRKAYLESFDAARQTANRIATLQQLDGTALDGGLTTAHGALRDAVSDRKRQTRSVFAAIEEFTTVAKAVAEAFGA